MNALKRFIRDQRGLETVEWVVMGSVLVFGAIIAMTRILLVDIGTGVNAISNEIQTATEIGSGAGS